jgi:hypothetical protein
MKRLISIIVLISFAVLSNALVFTTTEGRSITGTIKTNDSQRFVINTDKGMVILYKNQVATILDENGVDVKEGLMNIIPEGIIKQAMHPDISNQDLIKMTDREFQLYLAAQQSKDLKHISSTMWNIYLVNIAISVGVGIGAALITANAYKNK